MAYVYNGDNSLRLDYYEAPVLNAPSLGAGGSLSPNTTYYYKVENSSGEEVWGKIMVIP